MATPVLMGDETGFVATWEQAAYIPTPETEPEVIAASQRQVVANAYHDGKRTPEEISDAVDLPLWVVSRRLGELGLGPRLESPKYAAEIRKWYDQLRDLLSDALADGREMTTDELALAVGAEYRFVIRAMNSDRNRFEVVGYVPLTQRGHKQKWRLKQWAPQLR